MNMFRGILILGLVASLLSLNLVGAQTPENDMQSQPAVRAPELEPNLGWLNTDKPLRFSNELKGQVVLLDFWTYCCINCMHILPDLEYLEEKYKDQPVAIIGVHSAKFENEANRETIRAAIQRYKIKHPVVIDKDMGIWTRYTAQGWPTFVLIDSAGRVVAQDSGEGHREEIDGAIQQALDDGRAAGTLASAPIKIDATVSLLPTSELAFPGKILADEASKRLFIADSNHNRIVVSTLPDESGQAQLITTIGAGTEGAKDGSFSDATFLNPQGLALKDNKLIIADTNNHLLREADLNTSTVKTIAGTGKQGKDRQGGRVGTDQEISSPWDVRWAGDKLMIAMAGLHQIWQMDPNTGIVKVFSGSGRENVVDGPAEKACFAQPSGLAFASNKLYVADSEVSAVREVDLSTGEANTIVGLGLFVFGDKDGKGDDVRLQHALGITDSKEGLLIADTYNHKIKRMNPVSREVTSLYGTGKPGTESPDGKPAFFEPGGLDVAGNKLYVADTNNHRVVVINLDNSAWSEVKIAGLKMPTSAITTETQPAGIAAELATIPADATSATLVFNAELPSNAHPSAEAPMLVKVTDGEKVLFQQTMKTDKLPVKFELPVKDLPASGTLTVRWSFGWCTDGNASVCVPQRTTWQLPLQKAPASVGNQSTTDTVITLTAKAITLPGSK